MLGKIIVCHVPAIIPVFPLSWKFKDHCVTPVLFFFFFFFCVSHWTCLIHSRQNGTNNDDWDAGKCDVPFRSITSDRQGQRQQKHSGPAASWEFRSPRVWWVIFAERIYKHSRLGIVSQLFTILASCNGTWMPHNSWTGECGGSYTLSCDKWPKVSLPFAVAPIWLMLTINEPFPWTTATL